MSEQYDDPLSELREAVATREAAYVGRIHYLEEENDRVREMLAQAHAAIKEADAMLPTWWKLTPQQEQMMRCLIRRPVATKEMIYISMYSDRAEADWGDPKIIDVQICKIKKVLPPDIIEGVWGRGYKLSINGRKWVNQQIEEYRLAHSKEVGLDLRKTDAEKIDRLRAALLVLLDQVDHTAGACGMTEPVGACLSTQVIQLARDAVRDSK